MKVFNYPKEKKNNSRKLKQPIKTPRQDRTLLIPCCAYEIYRLPQKKPRTARGYIHINRSSNFSKSDKQLRRQFALNINQFFRLLAAASHENERKKGAMPLSHPSQAKFKQRRRARLCTRARKAFSLLFPHDTPAFSREIVEFSNHYVHVDGKMLLILGCYDFNEIF